MANAWEEDTGEGDDFEFAFSTDGSSWTTMFTVSDGAEADYSYVLPGGISGTVYVSVADTDQGQGNRGLDTVYVDYLAIRVDNDSGPPPPPPAAASGLTATTDESIYNQINIDWNDNSDNETGFRIERDSGSGWTTIAEVGANFTSFSDTGLTQESTHSYRVWSFNLAGDANAPSNADSATTGSAPAIQLFAGAGKSKGKHEITLTWSPSGSPMDVYHNGNESTPMVSNVSSGWVHQTGNKGAATYTYRVCEAGGTAACSDWITVSY
jgi:hypothetical protein